MSTDLGSIFMLHRVAPYEKGKILYNEKLKISPGDLNEMILALKQLKRAFVSLDELKEIVRSGKEQSSKFICFTLDDGYKDNLEFGFEVFKKHNVPFCVYVTNSFPNQTTNLWWYALEMLIIQNNALRLQATMVSNRTVHEKERNFLKIRHEVLQNHFRNPIAYFQQLGTLEFDLQTEVAHKCLSWQELKTLSNSHLSTIGCHTVNHYPLSKLEYDESLKEIQSSKSELESQLGMEIKHFAFPFGTKNEVSHRDIKIARLASFDTVVTTKHGHVYPGDDLLKLERIFLPPPLHKPISIRRILYLNAKSVITSFNRLF